MFEFLKQRTNKKTYAGSESKIEMKNYVGGETLPTSIKEKWPPRA